MTCPPIVNGHQAEQNWQIDRSRREEGTFKRIADESIDPGMRPAGPGGNVTG
jgi:hypothetical protein